MRKGRSIVRTNFICSMGFGLVMGCIFPLYASCFVEYSSRLKGMIFVFGCILAGLLVGFTAFMITRLTILKVVRQVGHQLQQFGTHNTDLSQKITIESHDVIGDLVRGFNSFLDSMNQLLAISQESSMHSVTASQELTRNMLNTSNAIQNIDRSLQDVNVKSEIQVNNVDSTRTAIMRLHRTTEDAISHVLELIQMMESLSGQLEHQSDAVMNMTSGIRRVLKLTGLEERSTEHSYIYASNKMMTVTNEMLENNSISFQSLSTYIKAIEEFAEKTSILSINASIEAARQGRAGEGFGVIAQEIRRLSSETSNLSNQISDKVKDLFGEVEGSHQQIEAAQSIYIQTKNRLQDSIDNLNTESLAMQTSTEILRNNHLRISGSLELIKEHLDTLKSETFSTKTALVSLETSTNDIAENIVHVKRESESIRRLSSSTQVNVSTISDVIVTISGLLNRYHAGEAG